MEEMKAMFSCLEGGGCGGGGGGSGGSGVCRFVNDLVTFLLSVEGRPHRSSLPRPSPIF